ncbi:cation:proton antiporter [Microlunatus panaciterrae]|uniref:NhaP-type Na+/H+ or K+/H+ antiporter n=1 Tax=Microlunatus panaciterrae TaxID=400768 RepID=A0ABS2RF76_9ACTN|nr:cation:proton antiporter [Microlunatus panaciterrae]MBM7797655.1 NhaP-type Na+/H+ or K+/H+ antiporter [Microlunatus panaciterrae]
MVDLAGAFYAVFGLAALAAALLPRVLGRVPISMPIVFFGAGLAVFAAFPSLPSPDPLTHAGGTEHLTEACVLVSLMGAGLALDRPFSWRGWRTTWRLLSVTMILSVLAMAVLGWAALGLPVAVALLLAAALAPTDPVLASEVQVAEPAEDPDQSDEDEARFALTSEAGLNDGLAFPVVFAAIAISLTGVAPAGWLPEWIVRDVLWRVGIAVVAGLLAGWLLRKLFFSVPSQRFRLAEHAEGFVALAATFLAYGFTQLVHGYGFLAVFVCACTIRAAERSHGYHRVLHGFVEQIERLLTVLVVTLLGGAVARGLLAGTTWPEVAVAAAFILVIRPLTGWVALLRGRTGPRERAVIAFFGVRGVGSLFYLAFALQQGSFAGHQEQLWRLVTLVVGGSILIHGVMATPVMSVLDRLRARAARERHGDEDAAPITPV